MQPTGTLRFAYDPADDEQSRRQKQAIFVVAGSCCLCGILWTAMYAVVFGWGLTAALPAAFFLIVGSALVASHFTRRHRIAVYAQILCIMYITAFIQWSIGGIFASGFVMVWSLIGPVTALVFFPLRQAAIWFALFLVNLGITLGFNSFFSAHGLHVDEPTRQVFFGMNLAVCSLVIFLFASYFAQSAETQRARANQLQESLEEEKAKQLGPYTLEHKIGAGGMGVVYRARHALLRRPTAIKLLPVDKVGEESIQRFEREVQHTATLTHPNTVAIHDYGHSTDGTFYYAMEYLDGIDLDTLVREYGPMPSERAAYILQQVCGALDEAHSSDLVHRDIKPANIMLCRLGNRADVPKVLDFGLVKNLAADDGVTREGAVAGTPTYMAPEAVTDPNTVGPAADLYAVGAMAFFLLTGEPVFNGKTVVEVFAHHLHTPARAPSSVNEGVPAEFDQLVLRCLAKDPKQRPASAREMGRALGPLALGWSEEHAHAWWDGLEARPSSRAEPVSGTDRTLLVDLDDRSAAPDVSQVTVIEGQRTG